jgi:ribonuclease J
VESGRLYLDGETMIGAMDGVVRERLKLARTGHIVVALTVDETGHLIADSEVRVVGGPQDGPGWPDSLEVMIAEAVDSAVERAPQAKRRQDDALEEIAAIAARRVASKNWGKKPVTTVLITRLEEE